MSIKKIFLLIYLCILITLLFFSFPCYASEFDYSDNFEFESFETSTSASSLPQLNSRSAVILEKSTGTILFGKNEHEIRKMASTTKIMTAIVVLENTDNLSEIITVSKNKHFR